MPIQFFSGKQARVFEILKEISFLSDAKFKMAAAIVRGNKIVGIGHNRMNRGFKAVRNNYPWPVEHCELAAVKNALSRQGIKTNGDIPLGEAIKIVNGSAVYIFRQWKNGHPALARPCERCQKAILRPLGITRIIYTFPEAPYFIEEAL